MLLAGYSHIFLRDFARIITNIELSFKLEVT